MNIPSLQIGKLKAKIPIIQGGMGVGISLSKLASAVANEGGIGIISGVQIGFNEPDFYTNTKEANIRALRKEIRNARRLSPKGILGVNFMVAMNNYDEMVKVAVEENIDIIISGAGLPTHLPKLVENSNTKIAPIVSSAKAAKIMCKLWDEKHSYIPDFIVVEGPNAGGHLGFKEAQLENNKQPMLKDLVTEVIDIIKPFSDKYEKMIPVIAAGGIYSGNDIAEIFNIGASGVQMATRFICTHECDADIKYKEAYIRCNKEDIGIIKSPVGMPGRAIKNDFIEDVCKNKEIINKCFNCLRKCNPSDTPYCISKALINAARGNIEEALLFTGSKGYKMDRIVSVKELINDLILEVRSYE